MVQNEAVKSPLNNQEVCRHCILPYIMHTFLPEFLREK